MVTGLFDLELIVAADGGLATVHHPGRSLDAHALVELIRWAGADQGDVRILAPVAEDHLPLLASVAWTLKRDVLVPPPGAELRAASAVLAPAEDAVGRGEEIVPVDAATKQRLDWRIVSPFGAACSLVRLVPVRERARAPPHRGRGDTPCRRRPGVGNARDLR